MIPQRRIADRHIGMVRGVAHDAQFPGGVPGLIGKIVGRPADRLAEQQAVEHQQSAEQKGYELGMFHGESSIKVSLILRTV